jgi:PAS domain S-box-containing protein
MVAGLIFLIILAGQIYVTSEIEWDAATINQAGSQRMRLFKLVLLTEQYIEYRKPETRALIDKEMTIFEAILHGLKHGDPRYKLKSADDPERVAYLDKNMDEWNKTLKPLFQNVFATSASRETFQTLKKDHLEGYEMRIDGLVAFLQAYSEKKVDALRNLLWLFLLASIVVAVGSVIYIHVIILKPIKMLAEASKAIAAGDFSRAVPVLSKDEIGELASDFNEMSVRLKNHIETLHQKTVELAAQKALIEADRRAILGLKRYAEDIIASLPAGLIVVDDALRVLSVNRSFRELFGPRNGEDVAGRELEDILPLPGLREQAQGVLASGTIVRGIEAALGEKQLRLAIAGIRLAEEEEEEEERLLVVVEDVSEERRLRAEARAHEQRFRDLVQGLDAVVWEGEASGEGLRFTFVSRRAETLLGFPVERWLAEPDFWKDLLHPDDRDAAIGFYRRIVEQDGDSLGEGTAWEVEFRMQAADGRVVWFRNVARRAVDSWGMRPRGVMMDITARKRAQAAHAELETQLRESQKMEAIGTLAGGIAHDFNNIIATILGNTELARQDVSANPLALESLEEIRKAGARARDLVQQILSFSRRQPTELKLTALAPIIKESVRLLRATLPARLTLDVHCDTAVPAVLADATQIQQILINLATNAMQAMRGGPGRIGIRLDTVMLDAALADAHPALGAMHARRPGRTVRLAVSDDGPGMDAATLGRIFEPFFTTRPLDEGTGLGLSVVHGIAQAHEGAIAVDSQSGKGATFTLYLPAAEVQAGAPEPDESAAAATATPDIGGGRHILYIDDDESLVFLVQRLLERRGYRVSGYTDQREALDVLRADAASFDMVVSDYNMPGMSGLDVAREVRAIRVDLPVAVTSGFIDEALRAQAEGAGVRELIFKANAMEDLCEAFARLAQTVGEKR